MDLKVLKIVNTLCRKQQTTQHSFYYGHKNLEIYFPPEQYIVLERFIQGGPNPD
jgi:hypothetical protein